MINYVSFVPPESPPPYYPPPPPALSWDPPHTEPRTEPFAVTALVLGLLACAPVAVPFAAAALVRIRRTGTRGKSMAVAGLAASLMLPLLATGTMYGGARLLEFAATPEGQIVYDEATVGDCVDGIFGEDYYLSLVPCDMPHDAEFLGRAEIRAEQYRVAQNTAEKRCAELLPGEDPWLWAIALDLAERESWSGEDEVICYMVSLRADGKLVGAGAQARDTL